jgi:hypothetical protein
MTINNTEKYNIKKAQLGDKWDNFVMSSPNGTAFMFTRYLNSLNLNIQPYFCYKKAELMGAILCILSDDGSSVIGNDNVIYDGLIYRNLDYLNNAQKLSEEFKVQKSAAEFLLEKYSKVSLTLHPSIQDIRSFLWCNFNNNGKKYIPMIKYTSYIPTSDFYKASKNEDIYVYNNASVVRRQEIRYGIKKQVATKQTEDIEKFINFYYKTMLRQGNSVNNKHLNNMRRVLESLIINKSCLMIESSNNQQKVGSMAVFLMDNKRAYYLFGASDPEMRNQHTGTSVLWDSFNILSKIGCKEVDLEGVNSPLRGWFKLSFGGNILPYYTVEF